MTSFHYPGTPLLERVRIRVAADHVDADEEGELEQQLREAIGRGLNLDGIIAATTAFFQLPLVRDRDSGARAKRWLAWSGRGGWQDRLHLVTAPVQFVHLGTIDLEWSVHLAASRDDHELVAAAEGFVAGHPIPAWHTAEIVVRSLWRRVDREHDERIPRLLDLISRSATEPGPLWLARAMRDDFALARGACRRRLATRSNYRPRSFRSEATELDEVIALDDVFASLFGTRCAIYKGPGILRSLLTGGSDEHTRRLELAADLQKRFAHAIALELAGSGDPFVRWYLEYLRGRIDGATGNLKSAVTHLRAALSHGICQRETIEYLAGLLYVLDREAEARTLLEHAALNEPLQYRDDGTMAPSTWHVLYETTGGRAAGLARAAEPPAEVLAHAVENRDREAAAVADLERRRGLALAAFSAARQRAVVVMVGRALDPGDLDAALAGGTSERMVRLDHAQVARAGLDEVPLPATVDRAILLAAVSAPAPAAPLALAAIALVDALESPALTFAQLAREVPALGRSAAVATRRARRLLERDRIADALALLTEYEQTLAAPDVLLGELFEALRKVLADGAHWPELVAEGRRVTSRRPRSKPIVDGLVALMFGKLEAPGTHVRWCELVTGLLEIRLDPSDQSALAEWLVQIAQQRETVRHVEFAQACELLVARLAAPYRDQVRDHAQMAFLRAAEAGPVLDAVVSVDQLQQLGPLSPSVAAPLVAWYQATTDREHRETLADLGERLCGALPTDRALADTVRERLLELLDEPDPVAQLRVLARILALPFGEVAGADAVATWYETWTAPAPDQRHQVEARVGEWLVARIRDASGERVRVRAAEHLRAIADAARSRGSRAAALERLCAVAPAHASAHAELATVRQQIHRVWYTVFGVAATLLILSIVIALTVGAP